MFENADIYLDRILQGLPATLWATVGGIGLTILLSFAAGIAMLSPSRIVRFLVRIYVEGFRGSSEVVQLFFFALAIPMVTGWALGATAQGLLVIGIVVLGLNHGSYGAEIVRGAIQSVPRAQYEGAVALNLSPAQRMWRVILPQAVVEMLPSFNNLFIQLLKSTALLSFIQVTEIVQRGEQLRPTHGADLPFIYVVELLLYLVLALVITGAMRLMERDACRRVGREPVRNRFLGGVG